MRNAVGVTAGVFVGDAVGVDVVTIVGSFVGTAVGMSLIRRLSFSWNCTWILRRRQTLLKDWSEKQL